MVCCLSLSGKEIKNIRCIELIYYSCVVTCDEFQEVCEHFFGGFWKISLEEIYQNRIASSVFGKVLKERAINSFNSAS